MNMLFGYILTIPIKYYMHGYLNVTYKFKFKYYLKYTFHLHNNSQNMHRVPCVFTSLLIHVPGHDSVVPMATRQEPFRRHSFLEMATRNGIRRGVGMVLVFFYVRQTAEAVAGLWESSC